MAGINTAGTANPNDYNLGRGKVYFANLLSSKPSDYRDLGNATEFNISVESEKLEHQSSRSGLKVTDKEVVISQKVNLSLTLDELNFDNIALFMSGSTGTHTNPTVSGITNIVHYDVAGVDIPLGRWYDIVDGSGNRLYDIKQNADVTIEVDTDSAFGTPTALVLDTDFTLDLKMGRFFLLSTATNIAAGDDALRVTVTADASAKTPDEVKGLTQTTVSGALKFVSENPVDADHQTEYQFHQVSLTAEGDFSLIGDEFTTMQLTGVAEKNETADADSPTLTIRTHTDA